MFLIKDSFAKAAFVKKKIFLLLRVLLRNSDVLKIKV